MLEAVKKACIDMKEGKADLMPVLVDAAKKGATNGEMSAVMRDPFGWIVSE
jgi:methylmalonyl-CoA mutase N-terminal domain/subunit